VPTNVPWADACRMNSPVGVVVPCPDIVMPEGSNCPDPDATVYVVPATVKLPLLVERV